MTKVPGMGIKHERNKTLNGNLTGNRDKTGTWNESGNGNLFA